MKPMMNWENPAAEDRLRLVFEGRNHNYGAFRIRKDYGRNLGFAFSVSSSLLIAVVFIPRVIQWLNPGPTVEKVRITDVIFDLVTPPEKIPELPPVTPPAGKLPVADTEKFTAFKVTDRNEEVENPPSQDKLAVKDAGIITSKTDSVEDNRVIISTPGPSGPATTEIPLTIEEMPEFYGGESALMNYLAKNIKYPPDARYNKTEGTVYISFVINETGNIQSVTSLNKLGSGCDEEAMRVISNMPAWKPGKNNGQPAKVKYMIPVRFTLR